MYSRRPLGQGSLVLAEKFGGHGLAPPGGLDKTMTIAVENMVAVGIALLIFFTGYEIVSNALISPDREVTANAVLLGGVLMSIALALGFSRYELRVGRETNSPSLIAGAQEYRTHIFSSGIVFLALVGRGAVRPTGRSASGCVYCKDRVGLAERSYARVARRVAR
jgi:hypothetical protein